MFQISSQRAPVTQRAVWTTTANLWEGSALASLTSFSETAASVNSIAMGSTPRTAAQVKF